MFNNLVTLDSGHHPKHNKPLSLTGSLGMFYGTELDFTIVFARKINKCKHTVYCMYIDCIYFTVFKTNFYLYTKSISMTNTPVK